MNPTDTAPLTSRFPTPIDDRYFEDYVPGAVHRFGEMRVTEQEIVDFARRYDPQDFHTDPAKAAGTIFGGLIASGWMTCGMMMRMYSEHYLTHNASLASPGIDELRWLKPVYPGDDIHVVSELIEKRRSRSRPEMGITKSRQTVFNQHGEPVMSMISNGLVQVRDPQAPLTD